MATYNDIFKITHNDILPAQGSILISEPFLQDAYFQRSVVLLVEHAKEGSMGFVLNKKTDLAVNSFFSDLDKIPDMPIFLGGPVSSNRLFFIHSLGDLILPNAIKINEHLYFDGNFDALLQYIRNGHPVEGKIKFFPTYKFDKNSNVYLFLNQFLITSAARELSLLPFAISEIQI